MTNHKQNSLEMKMSNGSEEFVILVAEDEEFNRFYIQELFEGTNYKMIEATNGIEAVEIAKTNHSIDLVLMDIKMPQMNGREAMMEIKTFSPEVPIIALTALAMDFDENEAPDSGFDSFLTKPIDRNALFEKIEYFIKTS